MILLAKRLPILGIPLFVVLIVVCNRSYEDVPDNMRTGLHPSLPHFSTVYHGYSFRFPGGVCDEPQCHGRTLQGGNSGAPSCYKCHGDTWTLFSTSHTINISGAYHHNSVDTATLATVCGTADCHGAGLNGVPGKGFSCYACHNPIPIQGHRVNYEGVMHHINVRKGNPGTYCNIPGCHADPGRTGPLCSTCHDD
jgi:hypothetical protein